MGRYLFITLVVSIVYGIAWLMGREWGREHCRHTEGEQTDG